MPIGSALEQEFCWVVDPLDGTTNYVHQVPHYAVSVALVKRGRPIAGTIYEPISDECYTALAGGGATLNGRTLQTSRVERLDQALVAASFSAKVAPDSYEIDQFVAALLACQAVRRTGSAALNLAYVAAGRFDAFWAMTTKPWDVAAGILLVRGGGGHRHGFGRRTAGFIPASPRCLGATHIARTISETIGGVRPSRD